MRRYAATADLYNPLQKRALGSLFCVLVMFYLGFHTVSGERGVFALLRESRKLETLKAELAEIKASREALDLKVAKLSDRSLDLDLLDEQARSVLGMAGKDEVILFMDKNQQ